MTPPAATHSLAPELEADADRALGILLDTELEPIVDMVLVSHGDHYEARTHDGSVTFRRTGPGTASEGPSYERIGGEGIDPLADQSTEKFSPLADERAARLPAPDRQRLSRTRTTPSPSSSTTPRRRTCA